MDTGVKLNVLCLYPHLFWTRKMSPVRRHSIRAIARRDDVELVLSGPGWPDYDVARPVQDNLARLMPDADVVLWYKPLGTNEVPPLIRPRELKVPACLRFNEAWWPWRRAMKEVIASGTELVICHHANDVRRFRRFRGVEPLVRHVPHCAERTIFEPVALPQSERPIPVLLTGKVHRRTYPLRSRFERWIRSGRLPGQVREHPTYELPTEADVLAQVQDYAHQLGQARIVVVDSSRYRYPLSKYTEAAMAGALVVGDMPESPPPGFADFVVRIDPRASDRKILATVLRWLEDESARTERAERGRRILLARYTQEHYAAAWVNAVGELLGRPGPVSSVDDARPPIRPPHFPLGRQAGETSPAEPENRG